MALHKKKKTKQEQLFPQSSALQFTSQDMYNVREEKNPHYFNFSIAIPLMAVEYIKKRVHKN